MLLLITSCGAPVRRHEGLLLDSPHVEPNRPDSVLFSNNRIRISKIDSASYFQGRETRTQPQDSLPYLENLDEVKRRLMGRVIFGASSYLNGLSSVDTAVDGASLYLVRFANGDSLTFREKPEFTEIGFVRYYPTEDVLVFEGGHSSDYAVDLRNGLVGPELVGNPSYIVQSPSAKFRLNGWFPGQECSSYFIQRKTKTGYQKYEDIPLHLTEENFDLCTIVDSRWASDSTLFFRNTYFDGFKDQRSGFFKLLILDNEEHSQ
ncbi:hypothetical protein [Sphingobacterium bambusae]|uniref:Lipoprotein n=1 Tax=Sphingobacterium bambusae TaxID=662858 RepID=A0ABW6BLR7_9SPHI|nr:hypothetical protein [Sphingobacterium bambusae]WPL50912.1 hypothetical protein SCB77_10675 [Sphingobacterium bambusae]